MADADGEPEPDTSGDEPDHADGAEPPGDDAVEAVDAAMDDAESAEPEGGQAPRRDDASLDCLSQAAFSEVVSRSDVVGGLALATGAAGHWFLAAHIASAKRSGQSDLWLRKLDPHGTEVWTRELDLGDQDEVRGVATDDAGNLWLLAGVNSRAWLGRLSAQGSVEFSTQALEGASAITVDRNGHVLVALPGLDVAKLDRNGELLWKTERPVPGKSLSAGIAVNSAQGVVVVGSALATDAAPGPNPTRDVWVRMYGADGSALWQQQYDGGRDDWAYAVAIDRDDAIIVVGRSFLKSDSWSYHRWLAKYHQAGFPLWMRDWNDGTSRAEGSGASVAAVGNEHQLVVAWPELVRYSVEDGVDLGTLLCPAQAVGAMPDHALAFAGLRHHAVANTFQTASDLWYGVFAWAKPFVRPPDVSRGTTAVRGRAPVAPR